MKRILLCLLALLAVARAQDINSCEYWIDADPGQGNGLALTISPSGQPTFDGTINTAALSTGLHTLGVRFKDDRNIWSSSEVRLFYVLGGQSATDLIAAEYWLDTDPGQGNGNALTITQGTNPVAIASLPFESVPAGLHTLGVRFKDDRNIWSSSEVRLFYVLGGQSATDLIAAEYWLDTDPGQGNGTALTITQGTNSVAIASLPFESVPQGLHTLGVRFKDDRNIWSSSEVQLFYVLGGQSATDLIAAEYWLDTDPGQGSGSSLTITQGTNPVAIASLPFESVPAGLHTLGVRFKDDRNIWSSSEVRLFYVVNPIYMAAGHIIAGAEYFINYDPGQGNGVAVALPTDGNWDGAFETITDSIETIPGGKHWLGVRFVDDRGIWSNVLIDSFVVTPILTIALNASQHPVLYWESADGATEAHIYRSANTTGPFTEIAVTTDTSYTDTENPPAITQRFYYVTEATPPGAAGFRLPESPATRTGTASAKQN